MFLENLVFDALEPQRLGRFWEAAIDGERLTDAPDAFETRFKVEAGPTLDLCFQRVANAQSEPLRLQLDLFGGERQDEVVERLVTLGARRLGTGPHDADAIELEDLEGNSFCVLADQATYANSGSIAAMPLESADPDRDADFWSWLTGWTDAPGLAPRNLRHPSLLGPLLEFRPETTPKRSGKNRIHLDVRLEPGDDPDEVAAGITAHGGFEYHPDWGEQPWRFYRDPSGNEVCALPARS